MPWRELIGTRKPLPRWSVEQGVRFHLPWTALQTIVMAHRPGTFWRSIKPWHDIRPARLLFFILAMLAASYLVFAMLQAGLAARQVWDSPPAFAPQTTNAAIVFLRVLINPFSSQSPGTTAYPFGTYPISPPVEYISHYWSTGLTLSIGLLVVQVLCAMGFAVLPQSRRKAKVKWSHIMRITLYGTAIPFVLFMLFAMQVLAMVILVDAGYLGMNFVGVFIGLYLLAVLPWLVAWWSFATGRYLQMNHPWGVGMAVVVMAILALVTLNAMSSPGSMYLWVMESIGLM